jgi:hypothetical protein
VARVAEAIPGVAGSTQQVARVAEAIPGVAGSTQQVARVAEAIPGVSGFNFNQSAMAAALVASVASLPAAASIDQVSPVDTSQVQVVQSQPLTPVQNQSFNMAGDNITININAPAGIDSAEVARLVRVELSKHEDEKRRKLRGMLND